MPLLYPCPKCGQLSTTKGRCPKHNQPWQGTTPMPSGWTTLRNRWLKDHPRCVLCHRKATTVDHIKARARKGHGTDPSNLRSLCKACADKKNHADAEEGKRRARG